MKRTATLMMLVSGWVAMVLTAACQEGTVQICVTDTDCSNGLVCSGGICQNSLGWESCQIDFDCRAGYFCNHGVCVLDQGIHPDGGPLPDGGDPGSNPSDLGGDPGSDPGPGTSLLLTPGVGIGPVQVSASRSTYYTLGNVRSALGENGAAVGSAKFTLSFKNQTLSASGIDSNASPNQVFDNDDHVISLMAFSGLNAKTADGLGPGSTLAQVHGRYPSPDLATVVPAYNEYPGGKMEYYFTLGLFVGYNVSDVATFFTVTRPYQQPPNAVINPGSGTLKFGGTTILFGDGTDIGDLRSKHLGALGNPDWDYSFSLTIDTQYGPVPIDFYLDTYRILGLEIVGGDEPQYNVTKLLVASIYAPFYGKTAAGHGLATSKAAWETELGVPGDVVTDQNTGITSHVYNAGSRKFAITYSDNGVSQDDIAVFLVLNYQTN